MNLATKKEAYLFLSAMLRAREARMLTREKAERMLDAPSFEDCAKLLTDCGYEDFSQKKAPEIEAELAARRVNVFKELESMCPDKSLVAFFRIKYDYHNAKVILKADAQGLHESALLTASGRVSPEKLENAVREEHWQDIPKTFAKAVQEAGSILSRTANPQLADFTLDKACFAELSAAAEASGSSFLKGYAAILADSTNLRSAVRTLRMGKNSGYLREALVSGGKVDADRIAGCGSGEALAELFGSSRLEKAAELGAQAAQGGSMTGFELACDNAVNAYLREAKLVGYGEEPAIAYLAAVENEITAVRMILTGRLAGIAPQVIRERLRDLYA